MWILTAQTSYGLPSESNRLDVGGRFIKVLRAAHEQSGFCAVVLVDEYDKPILDVLDVDKALEEELDATFREPIESMAEVYQCSYADMKDRLKALYDGYHFSDKMTDIYNLFSLLNAFATRRISDYWFKSGTPTYLIRLLSHTDENMNDITGKYYAPKNFIDYKADVEQPLPMIYQSGYLTIKNFDRDMDLFLLDYPNKEVKEGFLSMVASKYFDNGDKIYPWVREAAFYLRKGEIENFRIGLILFLASIPYTMHRKENEREHERYFHYTFYLLLRLLSVYTVYTEEVQSHGRVDCVVETPGYIYIFEFKPDGTADEVLRQIEEKGCAREYASDARPLYKIGASFSSETGTIEDWKIGG